jgi:hypothetical protein
MGPSKRPLIDLAVRCSNVSRPSGRPHDQPSLRAAIFLSADRCRSRPPNYTQSLAPGSPLEIYPPRASPIPGFAWRQSWLKTASAPVVVIRQPARITGKITRLDSRWSVLWPRRATRILLARAKLVGSLPGCLTEHQAILGRQLPGYWWLWS